MAIIHNQSLLGLRLPREPRKDAEYLSLSELQPGRSDVRPRPITPAPTNNALTSVATGCEAFSWDLRKERRAGATAKG